MRVTRPRLTVFRLLLVVVISAILIYAAIEPRRSLARQRYERCMQIAETHASLAAEYQRNSGGDAAMDTIAAWHRHMRAQFESAAERPRAPLPLSQPFPPAGWDPAPPGR